MLKVKVKQSVCRPVTGKQVSGKLRFPDFWTEVGKFVSPTHLPLLPPGNISGTHFC
jgi:hypothetical protein